MAAGKGRTKLHVWRRNRSESRHARENKCHVIVTLSSSQCIDRWIHSEKCDVDFFDFLVKPSSFGRLKKYNRLPEQHFREVMSFLELNFAVTGVTGVIVPKYLFIMIGWYVINGFFLGIYLCPGAIFDFRELLCGQYLATNKNASMW